MKKLSVLLLTIALGSLLLIAFSCSSEEDPLGKGSWAPRFSKSKIEFNETGGKDTITSDKLFTVMGSFDSKDNTVSYSVDKDGTIKGKWFTIKILTNTTAKASNYKLEIEVSPFSGESAEERSCTLTCYGDRNVSHLCIIQHGIKKN